MKKIEVNLNVIGVIHSPYKTREEAPRQGTNDMVKIEIFDEFAEGLKDIQGFSHLHLFYWLHLSKGYNLMVNTPWDSVPHGVFTTRSPNHPNPIGYSVVELIKINENILIVKGLDAIEGTPVIDIKPYIGRIDCKKDSSSGWLDRKFKS